MQINAAYVLLVAPARLADEREPPHLGELVPHAERRGMSLLREASSRSTAARQSARGMGSSGAQRWSLSSAGAAPKRRRHAAAPHGEADRDARVGVAGGERPPAERTSTRIAAAPALDVERLLRAHDQRALAPRAAGAWRAPRWCGRRARGGARRRWRRRPGGGTDESGTALAVDRDGRAVELVRAARRGWRPGSRWCRARGPPRDPGAARRHSRLRARPSASPTARERKGWRKKSRTVTWVAGPRRRGPFHAAPAGARQTAVWCRATMTTSTKPPCSSSTRARAAGRPAGSSTRCAPRSSGAIGAFDMVLHRARPPRRRARARRRARRGARPWSRWAATAAIHEVVNGLMEARAEGADGRARLGIIGQGTGGDFRRTLGLEHRLDRYCAAIAGGQDARRGRRSLLVRRSRRRRRARYFVNILSVGMGGLVDQLVAEASRGLGGTVAYFARLGAGLLKSEIGVLDVHDRPRGRAREEEFTRAASPSATAATSAAACTSRRWRSSTTALFEVVDLGAATRLKFTMHSSSIYSGEHIRNPEVRHFRCDKLTSSSATRSVADKFLLDVDGEPLGACRSPSMWCPARSRCSSLSARLRPARAGSAPRPPSSPPGTARCPRPPRRAGRGPAPRCGSRRRAGLARPGRRGPARRRSCPSSSGSARGPRRRCSR